MKQGFFVTGTDTNVGKTVVSAALVCALRERHKVCYWKPIQTGIETDNDTQTVRDLANCAETEIFDVGLRLEKPFSPHLSARLANVSIEIDAIARLFEKASDDSVWIVEGAGGVFVPLNEKDLMIDLITKLKLPVIIAARSGLGTINHTLLTLEALRKQGLEIAGVIMSGAPNAENRAAIEHFGAVKVLGELPFINNLKFDDLQNWAKNLQI
ncbi:MAG: dethiobiotin synthase [Pyrinomonadaceae bacterium]